MKEPEAGATERQAVQAFRVADLGDMRVFAALEPVDATGLFAVASRDWKVGETVEIPEKEEEEGEDVDVRTGSANQQPDKTSREIGDCG